MFFIGLIISIILGSLLQMIRPGKHSKIQLLIGVLICIMCYCFVYFCIKYNHIQGITIIN